MPLLASLRHLLPATFRKWRADNAPMLGAALAFYSVLSIGPLLLIVIAIAGLMFGREAASGELVSQMRGLMGEQGAEAIQAAIANAHKPEEGFWAMLAGVATLLFGASGVFGQLQDALNIIWGVKPEAGRGFIRMVRERFLSFTMVLGAGFLLMVSLIVSALLTALGTYFTGLLPQLAPVMQLVNTLVSFAIIALLFALMFKYLPDTPVRWQDVWIGALLTALLFTVGKYLIGLYLGSSTIGSTYGAAGSVVVLLVWIYYSAQIFFFGAEFTRVWVTSNN